MRSRAEFCFRTEIKGVKICNEILVVVLESKIYVFDIDDLTLKDTIVTV